MLFLPNLFDLSLPKLVTWKPILVILRTLSCSIGRWNWNSQRSRVVLIRDVLVIWMARYRLIVQSRCVILVKLLLLLLGDHIDWTCTSFSYSLFVLLVCFVFELIVSTMFLVVLITCHEKVLRTLFGGGWNRSSTLPLVNNLRRNLSLNFCSWISGVVLLFLIRLNGLLLHKVVSPLICGFTAKEQFLFEFFHEGSFCLHWLKV